MMNSLLTTLAQASVPSGTRSFGMLPEAASTYAPFQDRLFMFIFWVSVFFFVVLMGAMFYFVFKYRRRPGVAQLRSPSHNTPLEITWTVLPMFLLVVMFVWGFQGYIYMLVQPADSEEIYVNGFQWNWEFIYDNGAMSTKLTTVADKQVPIFPVPAQRPVKVVLSSRDVIHSFYVPDFRVKMDVFPNRYTTMWFESTDNPGSPDPNATEIDEDFDRYVDRYIFCTEYCGEGHSQMAAILRVVPESDYLVWKQKAANPYEGKAPAQIGELVYAIKGCNACHTIDGSAGTGPSWLGIWGDTHTFTDGSSVVVDENYVRESILNPSAKIVQGFNNEMQSYQGQITDEEILGVIEYMKTLAD